DRWRRGEGRTDQCAVRRCERAGGETHDRFRAKNRTRLVVGERARRAAVRYDRGVGARTSSSAAVGRLARSLMLAGRDGRRVRAGTPALRDQDYLVGEK